MTFHPHIFIETGFKRTGEPIWMLAVLEPYRRISVPSNITQLALEKQIPKMQSMVVAHYQSTDGTIEFWGRVESYRYLYAEGESIVFAPDGTIMGQGGSPSSSATLTLKWKELTEIIR